MDFIEKIQALSQKVSNQKDNILSEEATKTAFVMPFISALGYDVFNPMEVTPEFTADIGIKKGEKVDYAILNEGAPTMLFECKACTQDLDACHISQLYRYFSVTDARIGVLANGITYRFYSDLEKPNQMDNKPFLEFNILDYHESTIEELKKLTKHAFDLEEILTTAGELKYTREIKNILEDQLVSPNEDFVRFIGAKVYSGRITQNVLQQFTGITKRALKQFVNDQINKRLRSALEDEKPQPPEDLEELEDEDKGEDGMRVTTTEEEMEGYHIVKAILREVIDPDRIEHRDTISYFGVLLDDNNRKPICRLHFNRAQKYISLFDNDEKREDRIAIDSLNDIYQYAERLKNTIPFYDQG